MRERRTEIGMAAFLAGALLGQGLAFAEEDPATTTEPADAASRLVLPQGGVVVYAPLEINLSDGTEFEPTSLAPDIRYGVTPAFTVGLIHSTYGTTGFYGIGGQHILSGQGAGLCFTGEDGGCPKVYNHVGLDSRYLFIGGPLELAADGGLFLNTLDPFALAFRFGFAASLSHGPFSVSKNPTVILGVTERDPDPMSGSVIGNETWFYLPFTLSLMITPQLEVMAQKGIVFPIGKVGMAGFGDLFNVPLTLGVSYAIQSGLVLGGVFSLPVLQGGDLYDTAGVSGSDGRTVTVFVRWHTGDDTLPPDHAQTEGGHR